MSVGFFAGKWCSFTATPDLPHDQREEDGGALVFDTVPLQERIEILGGPSVELDLSSNKPVAMIAVRLSDIAPDGQATRVTYGLLNLTHRDSHEHPAPLVPDERCRVKVQLNHIAHVFPEGHRLRIAISTSYWPIAWAPPEPVQLTVYTGSSRLHLPVRPARQSDTQLAGFGSPEGAPRPKKTWITPRHYDWTVSRDLVRDISTLEVIKDEGVYRLEAIDLEIWRRTEERYRYRRNDFESPRGETQCVRRFRRGDWCVETVTRTVLTCDRTAFYVHADLDAYEGGHRIFCKSWQHTIPRKLV